MLPALRRGIVRCSSPYIRISDVSYFSTRSLIIASCHQTADRFICPGGISFLFSRFFTDRSSKKIPVVTGTILSSPTPPDSSEDDKEKARKQQIKSTKYAVLSLIGFSVGMVGFAISEWGPPRIDPETGKQVDDEFTKYGPVKQYTLRTLKTMQFWKKELEEPSRELLLPDPLKAPYIQPKYTVLVEMNGILTHPDWTYRTGWRFKKRPFVEYFIQQVGYPNFELVIFTSDPGFTSHPVIDSLDPNGLIIYRLYRDSTRFVDNKRVKDLTYLNRDLSKVIHIDCDPDACVTNPTNCLILNKWEGQDGDNSLLDLANFIRAIANQDVDDVREVLAHYRGFQDPLAAFKERQRTLREQEDQLKEQSVSKSFVSSFLRKPT